MALNVLTLGATGKVEAVRRAAQEADERYHASLDRVETLESRMKCVATSRGDANRDAHLCLGEVIGVLTAFGNANGFDVRNNFDQDHPAISRIQKTIVDFNVAIELVAGSGVGVATSLGAWAAVSALGVASTGVAIGGLSGAAASSAALAWFGGGSLATGGGGVALGSAVLGGFVLLPLIGVGAWLAHRATDKKVAEINSEIATVIAESDRLSRVAEMMDAECIRIEAIVLRTQEFAARLRDSLNLLRGTVQYMEVTGVALAETMSEHGFDLSPLL
jgi:hypothetical protein